MLPATGRPNTASRYLRPGLTSLSLRARVRVALEQ
jgi:hypothetical protein